MSLKNKKKIQKEIIDSLEDKSHGILLLAPRTGKTKIGIDIIKKEKPKSILWVTPSPKLRDVDIPEEFEKWKAKGYLKKTKIVCWKSLNKEVGYYDKIILDEYQEITPSNSRLLSNGQLFAGSILCLSGTHPEHAEKLDILSQLKLEILKEIDIDQAVDQGLIADYKINVIEVNLDSKNKNVLAGTKKNPFYTTEASNYNYISGTIKKLMFARKPTTFLIMKRMRSIYNSKTKEEVGKFLVHNLEGRKLVFCGSIEQSERLSDHTYNSKTDDIDLNKFLNEEVDTLACVKSGGTGFTYKNLDHLIIVQADSDKKGETTQKFARSLLLQGNYKAQIWFICLVNTQDEVWLKAALKDFDPSKIHYERFINLKNRL